MAYGISVKNSSGYTQIDSTYGNLQVIASGTTANFGSGTTLSTSLPSGVGNDIAVFVKPTTTSGVGQNKTVTFWGYINYSANTFVIGRILTFSFYQGTFDYVICVDGQTAPTSGYGFNTFTSGGALGFSSTYNDMECVEAHTYTLSYPPTPSLQFNESSAGWESGTDVHEYYSLLNAMGKVARTSSGGSTYYRASFAHYQYEGGISGNPQYISIGANWGFTAPTVSGTTTTVESEDTRTMVIARYHG